MTTLESTYRIMAGLSEEELLVIQKVAKAFAAAKNYMPYPFESAASMDNAGDTITGVVRVPVRDAMTDDEFNAMMQLGYEQALADQSSDVDEVFDRLIGGIRR